jgi:hypothetical protein
MTRLLGDDLIHLLKLMEGADSIELKLTLPNPSYRSAGAALGFDALNAQIRQIFFFDTPDLTLDSAGVVVRARRIQGKRSDSVVKLRPVVPSELDPALRASPNFGVEVDAAPGGYICSASMKGKLPADAVLKSVSGAKPLRKLFSKEQRALFAAHAPGDLTLDDLSVLGPIFVLKLKAVPDSFSRPMVAEMWLYPDGARVIELSTKCLPAEGLEVAAEVRGYLESKGVDLTGEQSTKTRTALEFFSAELRDQAATPA